MGANVTVLAGRLASDVKVITLPSGKVVLSNVLAVDRGKNTADFIRIKAWGKTAENLDKVCEKGDSILIRGHLSQYQDKNKNYQVDVTIDEWTLLRKKAGSTKSQNEEQSSETPEADYQPEQSTDNPLDEFETGPLLDISSDDLPF